MMYWHIIAYYLRKARRHTPVSYTQNGKAINSYDRPLDEHLHRAYTVTALDYFKEMKLANQP